MAANPASSRRPDVFRGVAEMRVVRAVRGAIQVDRDDPEVIYKDTGELMLVEETLQGVRLQRRTARDPPQRVVHSLRQRLLVLADEQVQSPLLRHSIAVLAVDNVSRGHDEVIYAPTGRFQHRFQVGVNLFGLRFDIASADHVAVLIRSGLSSDEQEFAALIDNSLAVTRPRIVERLRLDYLACHVAPLG